MSETSTTRFRAEYWIPRIYVGTVGAFLLLLAPLALLVPEWVMAEDFQSFPQWRYTLSIVLAAVYGLACVLPYSWSKDGWAFWGRWGLVSLFSLYMFYNATFNLRRHLAAGEALIVTTTIMLMVLLVLTPVTMLIYKRWMAA